MVETFNSRDRNDTSNHHSFSLDNENNGSVKELSQGDES